MRSEPLRGEAGGPPCLDTTPETRVLFLDMAEIAELHHVVQKICPAQKHPLNPIMPLGEAHEWDSGQASVWASRTVMYDEEDSVFKCWYDGSDLRTEDWRQTRYTGYATSEDGVHWQKPRLGLFEYNGNRDNNIVLDFCGPVVRDSREPDSKRRYKLISRHEPTQDTRIHYSPDGIHWSEGQTGSFPFHDMVHFMCDDEDPDPNRRYKLIWQDAITANHDAGPETMRVECLSHGPHEWHLRESPANPILVPDGEHEIHFLGVHRLHGYYIMLYEHGWYAPNGLGRYGQYFGDVRLAVSRDGEHYQRVLPNEKVIARGQKGQWDDGFIVVGDKMVVRDDEICIYYSGQGEDWCSWPGSSGAGAGRLRRRRMGLATLPLDRFTCLRSADGQKPGYAVTQPIAVKAANNTELVINVSDTLERLSWVEVEVLDAGSGDPLPGFGRADCLDLSRDALQQRVRWRNRTLAEVTSPNVRLKFWLYGRAKLHEFHFAEAS